MVNASQSKKYMDYINGYDSLFEPKYFTEEKELSINSNYTLHIKSYEGLIDNRNHNGSICILKDSKGKTINTWKSIDDSATFYEMINHKNGDNYFIFRQDLYGFSILDLKTNEIMQFLPQKALEEVETFIWTDVDYNPLTNVLAVSGCYWASPYSVQIFNFDNPLSNDPKYVDLIDYFENGHDSYDDIDFLRWDKESLVVKAFNHIKNKDEEHIIPKEKYTNWLNNQGRSV